jgi:hypothetical protein
VPVLDDRYQQLDGRGANLPLQSPHVPQASVFPRRLHRRRSRKPTLECNANHSRRSHSPHSRDLARHRRAGGDYRTVAWVSRHMVQHMAQKQKLVDEGDGTKARRVPAKPEASSASHHAPRRRHLEPECGNAVLRMVLPPKKQKSDAGQWFLAVSGFPLFGGYTAPLFARRGALTLRGRRPLQDNRESRQSGHEGDNREKW